VRVFTGLALFATRGAHSTAPLQNVNLVEMKFLFVSCVLLCTIFVQYFAPYQLTCLSLHILFFPGDFQWIYVDIPSRITGGNPVVVHLEAAINNATRADYLPLAPWH
jgi:hypothetical protein